MFCKFSTVYLNALSPSLMACSVSLPTCSARKVSSLTSASVPRQLVSMDAERARLAARRSVKNIFLFLL